MILTLLAWWNGMQPKTSKLLVLGSLCLLIAFGVFIQGPIPQPLSYHNFADQKNWGFIPNGSNVISNIAFLIVGLWGLYTLQYRDCVFESPKEKKAYWVMFIALSIVSIGSGYYHWEPDNETLFWDRLPMTVMFMTIVSILLTEKVHGKWGMLSLVPLIILGMLSLVWWMFTEWHVLYTGDLRFYIIVQVAPVVLAPFIVYMYEACYTLAYNMYLFCTFYLVAKFCELFDHQIFHLTNEWISGHALKHIAAAIGASFMIPMIRNRKFIQKSF